MKPSSLLPPSAIEAGLLAAVGTSAERLLAISGAGISTDDFNVWGQVYSWQRTHLAQYSALPMASQLRMRWPEWNPPDGEFAYYLAEMQRLTLTLQAQRVMNAALTRLEDDPQAVLSETIGKLARLRAAGNRHMNTTDEQAGQRFERYEQRAQVYTEKGGDFIIGIPTGLETLDDTHIGWVPSELVGFYARPTVGKTWMLVREGAVAWAKGYKVLMISPEMAVGLIELRVDAFMAQAMGVQLSHQGLLVGDPAQREQYQRYTQAVKESKRWWTFDSWGGKQFSVGDIVTLAEQLEPDMILVDGISLLRSEQRGNTSTWEKQEEFCYGLKTFATAADVVVIASHQSVNLRRGQRGERDGAGGRGDDWVMPSLNDAAGGDAFARACSTIFTMCPDKELANLRWYSVRKSRERYIKNWVPRFALKWCVDEGVIEDLGKHGENMGVIRTKLGAA